MTVMQSPHRGDHTNCLAASARSRDFATHCGDIGRHNHFTIKDARGQSSHGFADSNENTWKDNRIANVHETLASRPVILLTGG
jgi:hypothetical protein